MLVVALTVVLLENVDEMVAASSAFKIDEALAELLPEVDELPEAELVLPPDVVVFPLDDVVVVVLPPDVVVVVVVDSEAVASVVVDSGGVAS